MNLKNMKILSNHDEWLKRRELTIGGSDAAAVVGMNPYKTNVDLYLEKVGQATPEDISDKPFVKYGTQAEKHLRELFRLDFPKYEVFYEENNLFLNNKYPWGHYSADGWLKDKSGRFGILEIKTTNIVQSVQREKWKDRIPDNYYIQLLHGFLIMEVEFAVLVAQLKSEFNGEIHKQTKHYFVERADVEEDIQYLAEQEEQFWKYVEAKKQPSLILPNI